MKNHETLVHEDLVCDEHLRELPDLVNCDALHDGNSSIGYHVRDYVDLFNDVSA